MGFDPLRSAVEALIAANLPDNTTGQITPAAHRAVLEEMLDYIDNYAEASVEVVTADALVFEDKYQHAPDRVLSANVSFTKGAEGYGNGAFYTERIESNGTFAISFSDDFIEYRNDYDNTAGIYELACSLGHDGKIRFALVKVESLIVEGDLTFGDIIENITRVGENYTSTGSFSTAKALSEYYLPADTDGYIEAEVKDIGGTNYGYPIVMGFSLTDELRAFSQMYVSMYLKNLTEGPIPQTNGSGSANVGTIPLAIGTKIRVQRTGSTWEMLESVGGGAWTVVHTYSNSNTAAMYIVLNMNTNGRLSNPKYGGGVTLKP